MTLLPDGAAEATQAGVMHGGGLIGHNPWVRVGAGHYVGPGVDRRATVGHLAAHPPLQPLYCQLIDPLYLPNQQGT